MWIAFIHEPALLTTVALLSGAKEADFRIPLRETGLEEAAYVEIEKTLRGKIPLTPVRLTSTGKKRISDLPAKR